jgi:hypothetical protein
MLNCTEKKTDLLIRLQSHISDIGHISIHALRPTNFVISYKFEIKIMGKFEFEFQNLEIFPIHANSDLRISIPFASHCIPVFYYCTYISFLLLCPLSL